MKKILAMILAMVMALSLVACGQTAQDDKSKDDANSTSAKTFIMGIDAEYPPFSYLDADGNYTGFDVEVCKAACDLLGWELQIFPVNWDQKLVQLGDSLVGLIRRSKGRDNKTLGRWADQLRQLLDKWEES